MNSGDAEAHTASCFRGAIIYLQWSRRLWGCWEALWFPQRQETPSWIWGFSHSQEFCVWGSVVPNCWTATAPPAVAITAPANSKTRRRPMPATEAL